MTMYERTVHYDCDNHKLHLSDTARHSVRSYLSPKQYFGLGSVIERDDQLMKDDYGCDDFVRTLSKITEVKDEN